MEKIFKQNTNLSFDIFVLPLSIASIKATIPTLSTSDYPVDDTLY